MRRRRATILFSMGWLGVLALALRLGATAHGVNPEQLLGLLVASYLGTWGLVFFLSRRGRREDAARFLACTGPEADDHFGDGQWRSRNLRQLHQ